MATDADRGSSNDGLTPEQLDRLEAGFSRVFSLTSPDQLDPEERQECARLMAKFAKGPGRSLAREFQHRLVPGAEEARDETPSLIWRTTKANDRDVAVTSVGALMVGRYSADLAASA